MNQKSKSRPQPGSPVFNLCEWVKPAATQKFLLKYLVYKNFSFNLAKQISYKQKQTRYGRAINFGETKERKNE
jgi:hypothetical protein